MTRTINTHLPKSVSKRLPMLPEEITVPDLSLPTIKRPHFSRPNVPQVSMPHLSRPNVSLASLPEEARRPIYATVGAGDLAVERVREAAVAVQERITGAQKSVAAKAGALKDDLMVDLKDERVTDNIAGVTSTYAEFARRGEQVLERIWPTEADASASAPVKKVSKTAKGSAPKSTTKPRTKAPTKPTTKRAAKAPAAARATGPRAAAQQPTKVAAPRTPKTTSMPKAGSTEPRLKPVPKSAPE